MSCLALSDPTTGRYLCEQASRAARNMGNTAVCNWFSKAQGLENFEEIARLERAHVAIVASTKSHASEKIKSPYFGIVRIASDVFFDADSESPHMT